MTGAVGLFKLVSCEADVFFYLCQRVRESTVVCRCAHKSPFNAVSDMHFCFFVFGCVGTFTVRGDVFSHLCM